MKVSAACGPINNVLICAQEYYKAKTVKAQALMRKVTEKGLE